MIARTWRGRARRDNAADYEQHFTNDVVPNLNAVPGHRGAWLLRNEVDDEIEFTAITLWDTIESIKAFAGDDPTVAHIEPAGLAALTSHDNFATNHLLVHRSWPE